MRFIRFAAIVAAAALSGCATFHHGRSAGGGFTADSGGAAHHRFGLRFGSTGATGAGLVDCIAASSTPCNTSSNPGNGTQGMPAWQAFGTLNGDVESLYGMFGVTGILYGNGGVPNALTAATGAQILAALGLSGVTAGSYTNADITVDQYGRVTAAANGSGGSGSVTVNGQSIALGGSGNVNAGASQYSIALNGVSGAALGGIALPGSAGTYCIDYTSLTANPTLTNSGCPGSGSGSGTVTSFSFSTGNGFSGTITNPTTTPALSLWVAAPLQLFTFATTSAPSCTPGEIGYATDGSGAFSWCNQSDQWVNNGSTPFSIAGSSGCSPTVVSGEADATGGAFTLSSGCNTGTATVTVTFNGSVGMTAGMWDCGVGDQSAYAAGDWIPSWRQSSSTPTTATIPIPAAANATGTGTDTITFSCTPH